MFSRDKLGGRRVSPPVYRLLLTAHVIVSVGWLGVEFAKLVLGLRALASDAPEVSDPLYSAREVVNVAFPQAAAATLVTGVLLSLGTKWGLLRHYGVATKLVLCLGVIAIGIPFVDRHIQRAVASVPVALLISVSAAHVLMLGAATVLSVYEPWGKASFGQQKVVRSSRGSGQETAGVQR